MRYRIKTKDNEGELYYVRMTRRVLVVFSANKDEAYTTSDHAIALDVAWRLDRIQGEDNKHQVEPI